MTVLVGIALKSLIVALLSLGLLKLMNNRSAAERSWVAHIGLLSLLIMGLAPLALPKWRVAVPTILGQTPAVSTSASTATESSATLVPLKLHAMANVAPSPAASALPKIDPAAVATAVYALPAAILLAITAIALLRLFALRARAEVLVDGHWLSALARAQRRMGFKHGTALLTSDELVSPISWGLVRPVILLSSRAVEASSEAEAIIAHELAHVARMDWIKLLLARLATAMFWFNPLVWQLAREAHQLREEAADDSVLASDVVDTDYAQLLVGVARHECPGLLLGAHGVAPSRNSLARRVARVLDGKSVRSPVARSFGVGVLAGAMVVAAPLAALTLTPASPVLHSRSDGSLRIGEPQAFSYSATTDTPTDLPHLILEGVSTSVGTATAAIHAEGEKSAEQNAAMTQRSADAAGVRGRAGETISIGRKGSDGRLQGVAIAQNGATAFAIARDDESVPPSLPKRHSIDTVVESAIEMKAMGISPEFVAAMRAASPALRDASVHQIVGLKAVGVTPDYVRRMVSAGFPNMPASEIEEARAIGLDPDYMRAMRETGVSLTFDDLVQLRTMAVQPTELARMRAAGSFPFTERHRKGPSRQPPSPARPPEPPPPPDDG